MNGQPDITAVAKKFAPEVVYLRLLEVEEQIASAREALTEIAAQQQKTLAWIESWGIVFDSLGTDPKNWQHVAFSIYTDLCEVDMIARNALKEDE